MENRTNRKGIEQKRKENKTKKKIKVCGIKEVNNNFTIIKNATITLLDSEALHVYLYLLSRCIDKECCYPSREIIVNDTGINKNKLTGILNYLKDFGLLRVEKRKSGTHYNNVYYMYAIEEVTEIIEKGDILIEKKVA